VTHNRRQTTASAARRRRLGLGLAVVCCLDGTAAAQPDNPVYVDDSPRAWELFRQAREQAKDNIGEAVRLYQELLDDYAMKLLPINETSEDHLVAVKARVLAELLGNRRLLERYRLLETGEARRLLESGQLPRLALTRSVTEPGLESLLRLAQDDLESARFRSALGWLSQAADHPDLSGPRAAHCWFMSGLAAHYLGDAARLKLAVGALDGLGDEARVLGRQLDRLLAESVRPAVGSGISPLDRARAAELDELVAQPIWSIGLEDTPLGRALVDPPGGEPPTDRRVQQMRRSGGLLTAAATAAGSAVYVNEGRTIRAVERFTGRPLWPPYVDRPVAREADKVRRQLADLNIVALSDGALVTITGHAYADAATSDRRVVCLDAHTGGLRWATRIDRLPGPDELEGLFPHGAPVIRDGLVFLLARKVSRQLLTSCYVIALDLADGRLRWARHVASSGGIRTRLARPFSTVVYHEGDLAVATAVGAVARLDATTGQTRWLRRYNPPLSPYLPERRPWEISGPVITDRGLIALRPDHRRVVCLDWDNGDEIESITSTGQEAWNAPHYLLANEGLVFAVGIEVHAFRIDGLQRPIWTLPARGESAQGQRLSSADRVEIRGRVQQVEGALVVPTSDGVLLVDDETGHVRRRLEVELVGNPLATGPQLILAASDRLQSYMPFARAEQMLRQQIVEAPADPAPALALMRLGMRVRNLDLALEVSDMVIQAINVGPATDPQREARRELFEILLELDRQQLAGTIEQGAALHATIGVVALESDQRVEHLLAHGDWLSTHALGRAIEAYQAILSTPALAGTPRTAAGSVRPAASWAAARLGSVIEEHGRDVYQPQADFARSRLEMLRRDPAASPEQYVALAREFPHAEAAMEAAARGATIYAANGDLRSAVGALTATFRAAPRADRAGPLLGRLVWLSEQAGWSTHARAVLRHVAQAFGDMALETPAGRRDASGWLAELEAAAAPSRKPRIGVSQGIAQRRPGVLIPSYPGATAAGRPDRVLLYDAPDVQLITGPGLEPVWSATLDVLGAPHVLRFDEGNLLLWVVSAAEGPMAVMLDPATGFERWSTPSLSGPGREPGRARPMGRGGRDLMPNGQPFDATEALPLLGRNALVVVQRTGEAIALDLADGRTPLWRRWEPPALDEVHLAQIHDFALVLTGVRRSAGASEPVPAIVVLDPATGRTLHLITPRGGSATRWMTIGPFGSVVYGTARGVEKVDLLSGETVWSSISPGAAATLRGWPVDGHVVVESPGPRQADGPNPLRALRLSDGTISEPFDVPDRGQWDRLDLRDLLIDDGRIFAHYGQRIVRFHLSGAVLGADIVSDHRDYRWLLASADRLPLVSRLKREQVIIAGQTGRQTQHTYRLYTLSENCKLIGEAFQLPSLPERLQRAAVIDGWLLLSTPSSTLAVACP
jgi:outer membrane protein assembly factor BamB